VTSTFSGTVVRKPVAQGSKSEHDAVVLATDEGEFLLRRLGGNPFVDPILDELVGKTLAFTGELLGATLVVSAWTEIGGAPSIGNQAEPTPDDE
jgi:hypothetical protein